MNSHLILGTELGLPGLLCFVAYVGLALGKSEERKKNAEVEAKTNQLEIQNSESKTLDIGYRTLDASKTACWAGAIVLLVAFWFDGGLFTLATASVFWILLELGSISKTECRKKNEEEVQKSEAPSQTSEIKPLPSGFTLIEIAGVYCYYRDSGGKLTPVLSHSKRRVQCIQWLTGLLVVIGILALSAKHLDQDNRYITSNRSVCLGPQYL